MWRLRDSDYRRFSSSVIGLGMAGFWYFGLIMLETAGVLVTDFITPNWVWRGGLVLLIVGLALDVATRRVSAVLLYKAVSAVTVGLIWTVSAWVAAAMWRPLPVQALAALAFLGGHLLMAGWAYGRGYRTYQERPNADDAVDPIDTKTGLFDPGRWMSRTKERKHENTGEVEAATKVRSIAANLILLIVAALGTPGYKALWVLLGGAGGLLMSYLAATTFAQFVVISRWEHSHRTGVYLMKRSL